MSAYLRTIAALFAFVIGVSSVHAVGMFVPDLGVLRIPFLQSEIVDVAPPRVPDPPAIRFKRHRKHSEDRCRKNAEIRGK